MNGNVNDMIDTLQEEVLQEENLQRLYEIQIDLSKLIANCHRQSHAAETELEQSNAKGDLGIFCSMREVLQSRISELKEKAYDETNERRRIDYNFRMACKSTLKKETYMKILDLATKTRKEVKEQRKELFKNKLE